MRSAILALTVVAAAAPCWTPRKLVGTYPNWNYWWLNVRIGVDQFDTVYCAVNRHNYSQSDPDFDLYVLSADGDTVRVTRPWHGYEHQPIVQDGAGRNLYIDQPLLGFAISGSFQMDAGAVDDSNTVSSTNSYSDTVFFTRLGAAGNRITWRLPIYEGDPWPGRTDLALDARGWLHCTFADSLEYLIHGASSDRGLTWKWDTLDDVRVMSHVRVVTTSDTCVHIVYRTWTSGVQLRYLKLRPDGALAVGSTMFTDGSERWEPNVAVDDSGDLRVVFVDGAQSAQNLYYTVLRGDLDTGGQPSHDSVLTIVPDTVIQTDPVRIAGPKVAVDGRGRAHILFEQGVYGNNTTKYVYHFREGTIQAVEERVSNPAGPRLQVRPNPMVSSGQVRFALDRAGSVRLALYDASGRLVRQWPRRSLTAGLHGLAFARAALPAGVYLLALDAPSGRASARVVLPD